MCKTNYETKHKLLFFFGPFLFPKDSFLVPIEFANSLYDVSEGAGSVTVTIEFKFLNQPLPIPEDGSISK